MASVMIITLPGDPAKEKELDCDIFCQHVKGNPAQKAELLVLCSHCPVLLWALTTTSPLRALKAPHRAKQLHAKVPEPVSMEEVRQVSG